MSVSSSARPVCLCHVIIPQLRQKLRSWSLEPKTWPGQTRERPYTGHGELAWLKSIISLIGARLGTGDTPHHVIYQFCRDVIMVQLSRPIIDPILQCEKNRERAVTNRSPTIMCLHARQAGDKCTCHPGQSWGWCCHGANNGPKCFLRGERYCVRFTLSACTCERCEWMKTSDIVSLLR